MNKIKLMLGDNIESLKKLPDNSIDSIVSDPPYALTSIRKRYGKEGSAPPKFGTDGAFQRAAKGFMGKEWDSEVPTVEFWREVYRVLKPGGHVLSFGGTRTYHRMAVNIEDAGFEIRDQIMWLYGSGFPKSHNIGKAIDATIKTGKSNPKAINKSEMSKSDGEVVNVMQPNNGILGDKKLITKNVGASLQTEQAQQWEGWGTSLKPANEPICVARKPLSEKSVAANVLKWGTGGINIDGCRIGTETISSGKSKVVAGGQLNRKNTRIDIEETFSEGRFPANIILDEEAGRVLDQQLNASRFFYQAKVSKKERNMGLDAFDDKTSQLNSGGIGRKTSVEKRLDSNGENAPTTKNSHPTVKPVNLMAYLCRLVTPPGGIVLDPFMGSGSTGIAARLEGFKFCGMEMDPEYFKIAETRINNFEEYRQFIK